MIVVLYRSVNLLPIDRPLNCLIRTYAVNVDVVCMYVNYSKSIPIAALSTSFFCCHCHAGIAGSNPLGVKDVCLL